MLEQLLQEYKKTFNEQFPLMLCRGCDDDEIMETLEEINSIDNEPIDVDKIKKKAIPIPKELFKEDFIHAIESDIDLLKGIYHEWFTNEEVGEDPKYNEISRISNRVHKIIWLLFETAILALKCTERRDFRAEEKQLTKL